MIKIDIPESSKRIHKEKYYESILYILNNILSQSYVGYHNIHKKYFKEFNKLFESCNILIASPEELDEFVHAEKQLVSRFWRKNRKRSKKVDYILSNIFSYERFVQGRSIRLKGIIMPNESDNNVTWNAFDFLKSLNIRFCPYCNADTIFATSIVKKDKTVKIKSAFDHYYPQSKYPYLAISLYNLIPTCDRCNSNIKGNRELSLKKNTHPYVDNFHDGIVFQNKIKTSTGFTGRTDSFEIKLVSRGKDKVLSEKAENTARFFSIEQIYNALFKEEAADVIKKIYIDVDSYRNHLKEQGIPPDQIDRLIWGCSLDPTQINQNRLSKMIIDFVEIGKTGNLLQS